MARKTAASLKRKVGAAAGVAARVNAQMREDLVIIGSDPRFQIDKITTGSLVLDRMLLGGFPRGRHVEIFGDWQVGKSLLVYMTLIEAQQRGEVTAIVDGEGVFNEEWFTALGGDVDSLIKYRPRTANQLAKVLQLFVQHEEEIRAVDVVGIDSVASMLPEEELNHDFEEGDARVASLARLMSMLLRRITSQNDKTLFLWTNQWRDKISRIPGLMSTPGGRSLGFYATTRIEIRQGEKETEPRKIIHKGKEVERKVVTGQWIDLRLVKEKSGGRPFDQASIMLDYETRRFDAARELIDLGMRDGLIDRQGDYYNILVEQLGGGRLHGIKRAVARINENDDLRELLSLAIAEQTAQLALGAGTDE